MLSTESTISVHDHINQIFDRLLLTSLNIHIELNNDRFSFLQLSDVRQHSDQSLILSSSSSSSSNTLINELLACVEYYCDQIRELTNSLHLTFQTLLSSTHAYQIIDDLLKGSQVCLDVVKTYHAERAQAVQNLLLSPFREDAWRFVNELDSNIFGKCRIILIRLRMYFLIMRNLLADELPRIQSLTLHNKQNTESNMSIQMNNTKRRKIVDFKM